MSDESERIQELATTVVDAAQDQGIPVSHDTPDPAHLPPTTTDGPTSVVDGAAGPKEDTFTAVERADRIRQSKDAQTAAVERLSESQDEAVERLSKTLGTEAQPIVHDPGGVVLCTRSENIDQSLIDADVIMTIHLVPGDFPVVAFESVSGRVVTPRDVLDAIPALKRGYRLYQLQVGANFRRKTAEVEEVEEPVDPADEPAEERQPS